MLLEQSARFHHLLCDLGVFTVIPRKHLTLCCLPPETLPACVIRYLSQLQAGPSPTVRPPGVCSTAHLGATSRHH